MSFTSHRVISEVPTRATKPCWSPLLMPQEHSHLICPSPLFSRPSILMAFSLSLRHRHTRRTLFCRSLCWLLRALGALPPYPRDSLPHFLQALAQCHLLTKTTLNPYLKPHPPCRHRPSTRPLEPVPTGLLASLCRSLSRYGLPGSVYQVSPPPSPQAN